MLEIKKDYANYLKNKKLKNILLENMKKYAIYTSFYVSSKNAIDEMQRYNDEIYKVEEQIEEFEKIMVKMSYDEENEINEIYELTTKELAKFWDCSLRNVFRKIQKINQKYRRIKYEKIDK